MAFEYKIVPAPLKGIRKKGVKTPQDRFARALEETINTLAADGWEFQGSEALPVEERKGLAGTRTLTRHMLVFRRPQEASPVAAPLSAAPPAATPDLPSLSARREDPAIARPVRNLFAENDPDGARTGDSNETGRD